MTDKQKKLYKAIDEILWKDWDPIGVNDIEDVRDEYQGYTPAIVKLYKSKADAKIIADKLHEFETQNMGMIGNYENCMKIANKIRKLE